MCQQIRTIASGSIPRRIIGIAAALINVVLFPHSLVFDIAIGTSVPGTLFPARQPVEHQKGGRLTEALYRGASCPIDNISTIHPRAKRCRFVLRLAMIVLPPLQPRTLLSHLSFLFLPFLIFSSFYFSPEGEAGSLWLPCIRASHFSGAAVRMYQRYIIN